MEKRKNAGGARMGTKIGVGSTAGAAPRGIYQFNIWEVLLCHYQRII